MTMTLLDKLYARANKIIRSFSVASLSTKLALFKA